MKKIILLSAYFFTLVFIAGAQGDSALRRLTGTWKGTSLCQVRPSPCNDEIAIYHINPSSRPGYVHIVMNKEVNGVEEDMGELDYSYDEKNHVLKSVDEVHNTTWTFTVNGNSIEGTLHWKKQLYRIIRLQKSSVP